MIIQVRRRLLNAAKAHHYDNVTPPCVDNPEWYRVRSAIGTLPKGEPWYDNFHDWLYARTNEAAPPSSSPCPTSSLATRRRPRC